jgi:hypothetical protein
MERNRALCLTVFALVGLPAGRAGALHEMWELELKNVVHGSPSTNAANLPVQLLEFSPEG